MDNRVFIQIGTTVLRKANNERVTEPLYVEAYRLYKVRRIGTSAHTGGASRPCASGISITMPPRNIVTEGAQTNGESV